MLETFIKLSDFRLDRRIEVHFVVDVRLHVVLVRLRLLLA